jgi:choline dehydrogenase-like flavoprotein
MRANDVVTCDYVVIGSGAGGGTVAARLAEAGMNVVLLEAGGDYRQGDDRGLPEDCDVPAFHPLASENPAMRWDFFVRHYADETQQRRDPKVSPDGILYPRASTLGGCTAHNAMIFVTPDDSDWDEIAGLTADDSWRAANMRRYLHKVENCGHRPVWRWLRRFGLDPTGHGWSGWLHTERAMPADAFADDELRRLVISSVLASMQATANPFRSIMRLIRREADPNDQRNTRRGFEGITYTPLSTLGHHRVGTYQRIHDVAARRPDRLRVELNALATRVIFDEGQCAIGVEYMKGAHLYSADPRCKGSRGAPHRVQVRREVILSGGAFNTPQLLMLSGIGPSSELRAHGIPVLVDLPGVGQNLQDRYELAVVNRLSKPWSSLDGARFAADDPLYREWQGRGCGMYISNGSAISVIRRSEPHQAVPDLFCMALLARFYGYFPGYSREITQHHDYLSWAILKAHTKNRAGTVTLRSSDPRDTPRVNFHHFEEGNDEAGEDLRAVIAGIRFVRRLTDALNRTDAIAIEEKPGADCDTEDALATYVRDNAWGHHASCSCAIGPRPAGGVLASDFTVHGTRGLRVVDASVFPRIPGYFIASAIYIAAEKAADVILSDAMTGTFVPADSELPRSSPRTGKTVSSVDPPGN